MAQRTLAITAATLLPIMAVLAYSEYTLRESREREVEQLALNVARQGAIEMERLAAGTEGVLQAIAKAPVVTKLNEELCTRYLSDLKPTLPHFTAIGVFDTDGYSRCRSDGLATTVSFGDRQYFQDALAAKGRLAIGEYTISRVTGTASLPFALAVMADDQVVGVVVSAINLEWLGASLRARKLSDNASLTIADRNGTILAREPLPQQFVGTKIPDQFKSLLTAEAAGTINVRSQDGTRRILGYVPLPEAPTGLYISAGISRDNAFAAVNAVTRRNLLIGLGASAVSILLGWLLGNRLLHGPVRRISETVAARRAGNDDVRTGMTPDQGDIEAMGAEIDAYMDELNRARVEREHAEQHRTMLTHELSHRVKNLLATIQAIASQTFRNGADPASSLVTFNERLTAMAQAQSTLVLDRTDAATVREAISSSTSVFEQEPETKFQLNGPHVRLRQEAALSLAMAIHELCTNAVKYGALSTESGHVTINWALNGATFSFTWTEHGGPPAIPPTRRGFGSRMIERVLAGELGGEAELHYEPSGFRCTFEAPVEKLRDSA